MKSSSIWRGTTTGPQPRQTEDRSIPPSNSPPIPGPTKGYELLGLAPSRACVTFCGARPETTTPRSSCAQSDPPPFLDRWDLAWLSDKAGFLFLAREKGASSTIRFHTYPKVGSGRRGLGGCLCALSTQLTSVQLQPKFLYCRHEYMVFSHGFAFRKLILCLQTI